MIVDTSALIAILGRENDADDYREALEAQPARMSVATWLEATMVARGRSEAYVDALDVLIAETGIDLVAVSERQGRIARYAHRRYGRGSGSKAQLNFGDCFAYALTVVEGDRLLFKGRDFIHTDIEPALR